MLKKKGEAKISLSDHFFLIENNLKSIRNIARGTKDPKIGYQMALAS